MSPTRVNECAGKGKTCRITEHRIDLGKGIEGKAVRYETKVSQGHRVQARVGVQTKSCGHERLTSPFSKTGLGR